MNNNLFEFAPKELVQDAFLCWCFNFKKDSGKEEWEFSKKLVQYIYELCDGSKKLDIKLINPKTQQTKSKVDVLVEIILKNEKKINFIFENKLYTSPHSDQLKRHIDFTEDMEGENKYIYFKLGYFYNEDKILKDKEGNELLEYTTLDRQKFLEFLKDNKLDNDTFKMYYEFIENIDNYYSEQSKLLEEDRVLVEEELNNVFYSPAGQYEILTRIDKAFESKLGVSKGTSFGRPWTNIPFFWKEIEKFWKGIFWRIDWRKCNKNNTPYICLRYYKTENKKTEIDNQYLEKQRSIFDEISKRYKNLEFGKVHNVGVKEREIGILFFNNEKNTIPNIIKELPKFSREFIDEVNKRNAYYEKIEI